MGLISFKPKQVTKKLLSSLKDRSLDVINSRFGLGDNTERQTLEAIGQKYGITRERVRQIENASLSTIRKSNEFKSEQAVFQELSELLTKLGAVMNEDELLKSLAQDEALQNHVHFFFVLGDQFSKHKEDDHFAARWSVNDGVLNNVHKALHSLYESLDDDELIPESKIIERFLSNVKDISNEYRDEEIAKRWLSISKRITKNPLNEYGRSESKNVKVRGVKDYAYLVLRKHGNPMHFREVAESITAMFNKRSHPATTHNELIKDSRFVLVGRGKYGLRDWGYKPGVVREVIHDILEKHGPLSKEDLVEHVMRERFLKRNTILVNLQNPKFFKKLPNATYTNL